MLVNVHREYNVNRILLSCLGLWPAQSKLVKSLFHMLYCMLVLYFPFEILTLYMHRHSAPMIFECLYQMIISMTIYTKLLNQIWNRDKFRRLYEAIDDHWNVFTSDFEARVLKNYSNITQKFTFSYSIIIYIMMSLFLTIPSLGPVVLDIVLPLNKSRQRYIAIYTEYGIDRDKYFFLIFFYTSFVITVGMTVLVATDTMHLACTAHACSLFQVIGYQVENIISNVHIDDEDNKIGRCANPEYEIFNEEVVHRKFNMCLKKHQLAVEYIDILNDTHKIIGITFSLMLGTLFSILGIRIVYVLDQLEEVIRFIFIITGSLMQLMVVCYSGQKIMDESENIFDRAYAAEWYKFSPRLKSSLAIILHRSFVPCKLTAGNWFPLSMEIFALVVKTGVSYFTTFLSLQNSD